MKTADKINTEAIAVRAALDVLSARFGAAVLPELERLARGYLAGAIEQESWLDVLRDNRDWLCLHVHANYGFMPGVTKPGHAMTCRVCGHNLSIPF